MLGENVSVGFQKNGPHKKKAEQQNCQVEFELQKKNFEVNVLKKIIFLQGLVTSM